MNNRARNELIAVVSGILMIIAGVCLLMTKVSLSSAFLESGGIWSWWKIILVLIPLLAGIVMMAIKPHKNYPKIIASVGVILIIAVILANTTIIISEKKDLRSVVIYGIITLAGMAVLLIALFAKKKK